MKNDTLRVIVIEPGFSAEIREINHDLKSLRSLVGGHLEHVHFTGDVGFLINEEGKLMGLPPNRISYYGDVLVGTVVVVKTCGEEFCSLSEAEAEDLRKTFG